MPILSSEAGRPTFVACQSLKGSILFGDHGEVSEVKCEPFKINNFNFILILERSNPLLIQNI